MANKQANKRKSAQLAKRLELIALFKSMGHTTTENGTEISSLNLPDLQDLLKGGIKK